MRVTTVSGAVYEFDESKEHMRRIGGTELRKDGTWIRVLGMSPPEIGHPMELMLDGVAIGDEVICTLRTTTPVATIEGG